MNKKHCRFIMIIFLYTFIAFNFSFGKEYNQIKVGFYSLENEMEEDDYGKKSGYNYYYLQQIKKYSNFKYQYVYGTWSECVEKLEKGEIDIIVGMIKTKEREKKFDFSKYNIAMLEGIMVAPQDNNVYSSKFEYLDSKKIGVIKGEFLGEKYKEISEINNYKNEIIYYDTYKKLWKDFYNRKVDVVLTYKTSILSMKHKSIKIVDYFDSEFTYIAVKKGNVELLEDINNSIKNIKKYNEEIVRQYKYIFFQENIKVSLSFTEEEEKELANLNKIIFIAPSNKGYFSYKNNGNDRGIYYDLAKLICDKLGLELDYQVVNDSLTIDEIKELRKNIIVCGNYFDLNLAEKNNLSLTSEYLVRRYYKVSKNNGSVFLKNKLKIAAIKNTDFTNNYIKKNFKSINVSLCNNTEECLNAVYKNECDVTYCDYLVGNYYFNNYKYKKLFKEYISVENMSSFILNDNSPVFNSIINKTISSLKEKEIIQIISDNLEYKPKNSRILNWIYLNSIKAFIIGIATVFIILNFIWFFRIKKKNKLIKKVTALSETDSMTKLYNRETFEIIVIQILSSESLSQNSAFIMGDLDAFKLINDTYGHFIGDKVIIKVADLFKEYAGSLDVLGRMGGDEFAIFVTDIKTKKDIETKIQKLIIDINNCMISEVEGIVVKCSFGVSYIFEERKSFEQLYKEADDALYKAKSKGKNKCVIYK